MTPRILMIASSVVLSAAGIVTSFAPAESLVALGVSPAAPMPVFVQLLGATYLAFALTNWTAKDNAIGGIYSRPISLGNSVHFTMGALALGKLGADPAGRPELYAAAVVYVMFAGAFLWLVFGSQGPRQG